MLRLPRLGCTSQEAVQTRLRGLVIVEIVKLETLDWVLRVRVCSA